MVDNGKPQGKKEKTVVEDNGDEEEVKSAGSKHHNKS